METLRLFKVCSKCFEAKPHKDFHKDRKRPDGLKSACRECTNVGKRRWRKENEQKIRSSRKEEYQRNRHAYLEYMRSDRRKANHFRWKLLRQYGITVEEFDSLLEEQGGVCAICGMPADEANGHRHKHRLCVDHHHGSGQVRGLLCTKCNGGSGYFDDDPELMRKAIEYLERTDATKET